MMLAKYLHQKEADGETRTPDPFIMSEVQGPSRPPTNTDGHQRKACI